MKFYTNYNRPPCNGWTSELDSCTIPVQGKTIRELHQKYTRGTIDVHASVYKGLYDEKDAPFDAPLTADRLHQTDPVDIDANNEVIDAYIKEQTAKANEKVIKYNYKKEQDNKKHATTTTNDDDAKKPSPPPSLKKSENTDD